MEQKGETKILTRGATWVKGGGLEPPYELFQVISLEVDSVFNRWLMYQCYLRVKYSEKFQKTSVCYQKFISKYAQLCEERSCWYRNPCNIEEWWQKNSAIYQNNKYTSHEKKKVESVEPILKNIYWSNTYSKDLSRPYFDDEPRVWEK